MAGRSRPVLGWRGVPLAAIAASALLLSGCDAASVDLIVSTPTPTHTPRPVGQAEPMPIGFAPLRGTAADPAAMRHPSIAVKIDNHEDARPQIALNRTDLVFEELVEGGLTRYVGGLALRRARRRRAGALHPPDGSRHRLAARRHHRVLGRPAALRRPDEGDRTREHRVRRATTPALRAGRRAAGPARRDPRRGRGRAPARRSSRRRPCSSPTAPPTRSRRPALAARPDLAHRPRVLGGPVPVVGLGRRTTVAWLRSQEGAARPRGVGGPRPRDERGHDARRDRLAVRGGAAHRSWSGRARRGSPRPGKTAHGTWSKADEGAPIVLTADDGSPLRLAPGNTWIELVPNEGCSSADRPLHAERAPSRAGEGASGARLHS